MALTRTIQRQLFAVLREAGIYTDQRRDLIDQYTSGRTQSTTLMHDAEARRLIANVRQQFAVSTGSQKADRMRKKVIGLFRSMGKEKSGKADMEYIEQWCIEKGAFKKRLNAHSTKELATLISQVSKVYEWWIKQVNTESAT